MDLPDYNVISFTDPYRCFPLNATAHATVSGEKPVEFAMSYYFLVDFPPLAPAQWPQALGDPKLPLCRVQSLDSSSF